MPITYNIYRDGKKIASQIKNKTYTDTNLTPNTIYEYQVSSQSPYGESPLSTPIQVITEYSSVSGIEIDTEALELVVDETAQLNATVLPETAPQSITWTTENDQVATVDGGLVTAVGTGETTITARSEDSPSFEAVCSVLVSESLEA